MLNLASDLSNYGNGVKSQLEAKVNERHVVYDDRMRRYGRWLVDVLGWKSQSVLDVGCGTGLRTAALTESGAIAVGIDRSEESIQRGRRNWPLPQFSHQETDSGFPTCDAATKLLTANALDLHHISDNSISGVHAFHALEFSRVQHVAPMLTELARVAKPGSLFFSVIRTSESLNRSSEDLLNELPGDQLIRSYDWWINEFEMTGWSVCTEEFRLLLLAHGWSPLRHNDWDWIILRKHERYRVTSKLCVRKDFDVPQHSDWVSRLGLSGRLLRKEWEFAQIADAIEERGLLESGKKGLGFGVGMESLTAAFAAAGCQILATDIPSEKWDTLQWEATLNEKSICPPDKFLQNVSTRLLDMNHIPPDLQGFDFAWSACSLDHLGTIWMSQRFILESLNCVRPGGWCFHTAEYSLDPRAQTSGSTVYFTCKTLERLISQLRSLGHRVEPMNWNLGDRPDDNFVDYHPWTGPHLKLIGDGVVATSVLLIIQRGTTPSIHFPEDEVIAMDVLNSWIPMRPE